MLMITENVFQSFYHFEMDEIGVFLDITLSTFSIANVSRWLSEVHRQQTLFMSLIHKHPIVIVH